MRPVGADLFPVDGRTDMKKLIVAVRNFANATKNIRICDVPHQIHLTQMVPHPLISNPLNKAKIWIQIRTKF